MGWGEIDDETARASVDAAVFSACLREGDRLLGLARVVGDGVLYFYISGVILLPELRGSGHGASLMNQSVPKVALHDPVWQRIHQSAVAMVAEEPILGSLVHASVLIQSHFEDSLTYILARCLETAEAPAIMLRQSFAELAAAHPDIGAAARADLAAVCDRDPACASPLEALLFFKGYHAIQIYRLAHALLNKGRRPFALHLQNRMAVAFGIDINPAARLGRGLMIDHGTGVVIGETAVVEDGVSILQGVTLGGTGKEAGDRHPKIREGVMIGAGASILGNIEIGARAKIGAGSVVLSDVPSGCTAAGVPARVVGRCANKEPARDMDQSFGDPGP